MRLSRALLGFGVAMLAAGCATDFPAAPRDAEPEPADPWSVSCSSPSAETPAWLSNGLIGVRIGRDGSGLDPKTGGFFLIDEYDTDGEEKIRALANPFRVAIEVEGEVLVPDRAERYERRLDFRDGLLTVQWSQVLRSGKLATISCETAVHPEERVVGQRWTLSTSARADVQFRTGFGSAKNGHDVIEAEFDLHEGVFKFGGSGLLCRIVESTTGPLVARALKDPWGWETRARLQPGQRLRLTRVATFGTSPNQVLIQEALRKRTQVARRHIGYQPRFEPPPAPTFPELRDAIQRLWAKRWETDIEIEGPLEDQQAIRSFLFYLRSAIHPKGGMSVSPFGLSNSTYSGHVFWDADVWVLPALVLLDSERAKAIADYRLAREEAAIFNAFGGEVTHYLRRGDVLASARPFPMARFPWESGVSGKEVGPASHQRQIHVTGSILWGLNRAAALGLAPLESIEDLMGLGPQAARWFQRNATLGEGPNGTQQIPQVMGPDEHGLCDNDLYTNLLATWLVNRYLRRGVQKGDWSQRPFKLPRDSTTFLAYDGDDLSTYQQASAVLAIYPLQFPEAEKEARLMMERFEPKVIKNGPAMSDSIHAVIWARLGETERAYDRWRRSWQRYADLPLLMFSEKPNFEQTYFVTGAAGCLQSVLYGFLGFRIDSENDPQAAWSKPLRGGNFLTVKPNLPKAWKRVTVKNFIVLGKRYTLRADHRSVKVVEE